MYSTYTGQTRDHAKTLFDRCGQFDFAQLQRTTNDRIAKAMESESGDTQAMFKRYLPAQIEAGEELHGDEAYKASWVEEIPLHSMEKAGNSRTLANDKQREALARSLVKLQTMDLMEAGAYGVHKAGTPGVTTALGINFYDLRPPVELLYPVNVPIRNSMARVSRVNDGWGVAAHWMATRTVGSSPIEAQEGERVAYAVPDNNQYVATYKEIGVERAVSFTAQAAGEGFADNVADEHIRALHSLFLGEEGMDLLGNSGTGTGSNGYVLGTAPTPTLTQQAGTTSFSSSPATTVYVYLVCITPMGYPNNNWYGYLAAPTVASGLTPSFNRQNADGSQTALNGGTSQISAVGSQATTTTGNQFVAQAIVSGSTIPGVEGAAAYAWFVGTVAGAHNATLYAITTVPSVTITAAGGATAQPADAAGLQTDHSFQTLDYDGLLSYSQNAGGYYASQYGQGPSSSSSLTPLKMGGVTEIENALEYFWSTFQAVPSRIWCGFQARLTLDYAMKWGGTNGQVATIFLNPNQVGGLVGGFQFDSYLSKWGTPTGNGLQIPIQHHPMLPTGMIFFDMDENPYPHSRIPYARAMLVQRDYYSIEWPVTTRSWTFGTYAHQVIQSHVPWITGQITNVGAFVGN